MAKAEKATETVDLVKNFEVVQAQLHQPINIGSKILTQSSLHKSKVKGLKMYHTDHGLLLEIKDTVVCGIVPFANVAVMTINDGKQEG